MHVSYCNHWSKLSPSSACKSREQVSVPSRGIYIFIQHFDLLSGRYSQRAAISNLPSRENLRMWSGVSQSCICENNWDSAAFTQAKV